MHAWILSRVPPPENARPLGSPPAAPCARDIVQASRRRIIDTTGDQEAALSAVGVVELVHGIHRADTAERRARREAFVEELLATVAIYPLTTDVARLAGKIDAEQ
jgi:predicted nucleic acid-binding protein